MKIISRAILASRLLLLLLIILTVYAVRYTSSVAEGPTALGADMDSAGNTPTSLGSIEDCISVDVGETFTMDIIISNVSLADSLSAWEMNVAFDPSIVEVVDQDVKLFLASEPGSSLITLAVPLSGGRYFLGAADIRGAAESGSGVLAQLTLKARAAGVSLISVPQMDINGDGNIDMGPRLTNANSGFVGDLNGDSFFDGPTITGAVAVDQNCSAVEVPEIPTPTPTDPEGPGPTPEPSPPAESPPDDSATPSDDSATASDDSSVPKFVALPAEITDSARPDPGPPSDPPSDDSSASSVSAALPAAITDSVPSAVAAAGAAPAQAADTSSPDSPSPDQAADTSSPDSPPPRFQGGESSSGNSFPLWLFVPIVLGALSVPLLIAWWRRI